MYILKNVPDGQMGTNLKQGVKQFRKLIEDFGYSGSIKNAKPESVKDSIDAAVKLVSNKEVTEHFKSLKLNKDELALALALVLHVRKLNGSKIRGIFVTKLIDDQIGKKTPYPSYISGYSEDYDPIKLVTSISPETIKTNFEYIRVMDKK